MTAASHSSRALRRHRAWVAASAVLLSALAAAPSARAATPEATSEARARFGTAIRLYDERDYAAALAEFKRAQEVAPSPIVVYNIARCYMALGRPVDARATLEPLVADASTPADQRARASQMMSELEARIGTIEVTGVGPGARVEIDGLSVGTTPLRGPIPVASGSRIVTILSPGYAPFRKEVLVAGRAHETITAELVPTEAKLAHLEVKTNVPSVDVRIDSEAVGTTPLPAPLTLLPGTYDVALARRGYDTENRKVTLGDGARGAIDVQLRESAGGPKAQLSLTVSEPSPVVFVDGQPRGSNLDLDLPPGLHRLRVEHAGFVPLERDVTLVEGSPERISVRLVPTAETRYAYESSVRSRKTVGWSLFGGGVALAAGGGVLAYFSTEAVGDFKRQVASQREALAVGSGAPCSESNGSNSDVVLDCKQKLASTEAKLTNAQTRQLVGVIVAGAGGAALVTGAVLLLTAPSSDRFAATGGESARLRPSFGWGGAGPTMSLSGTF